MSVFEKKKNGPTCVFFKDWRTDEQNFKIRQDTNGQLGEIILISGHSGKTIRRPTGSDSVIRDESQHPVVWVDPLVLIDAKSVAY